jgi:hypothetical protein
VHGLVGRAATYQVPLAVPECEDGSMTDQPKAAAAQATSTLLEELWRVETAGHVRRARVHRHPQGFEVRIDADDQVVETATFESRPEADAFAEARRQELHAGGMTADEDETSA